VLIKKQAHQVKWLYLAAW